MTFQADHTNPHKGNWTYCLYMKGTNSTKETSNKDYIDMYTYILINLDVTNQREVYDLPTI